MRIVTCGSVPVGRLRSSARAGLRRDEDRPAVELLVVGEQRAQLRRDAVVADLGRRALSERRDALVVTVEHHVAGRGRGHLAEQTGGRVDLTEPIELVAHHVQQQRAARWHDGDEAHRPRLVQLEHRDVVGQPAEPARVLDRGGDRAADEVAAGVVRQDAVPLTEDGRDHLGGRGLAVRAGDHDDALVQLRRGHAAGSAGRPSRPPVRAVRCPGGRPPAARARVSLPSHTASRFMMGPGYRRDCAAPGGALGHHTAGRAVPYSRNQIDRILQSARAEPI